MSERFDGLLRAMAEADGLKHVQRGSWLVDGSRAENSAEHTWHASLLAMLLHPELEGGVDLLHALRMLQVHDLVEIDAGDAFAYDPAAQVGREERERAAADRIFAELPGCRALWDEFEACETAEARFARACDKLQPLLLNVASGGAGWRRGGIRREQVLAYNRDLDGADAAVVAFRDYLLERAARERMFSD